MNKDIAIEVINVSKVYTLRKSQKDTDGKDTNKLLALKNVSFEVKKGEAVSIIGANGSGKSTLLKILAGVTKPTAGEVNIRGKVASILDIGAGFHPELSGRENVFLNGQILGFSKKEIQKKYDEIIAFSEIEKFIDEPVKNYSNGMYLRLAFSIMAHLDFDVYLFDEVLNVGDADFQLKTRTIISKLLSRGCTIINVSHVLTDNKIEYSKVLFFKSGTLEKSGSSDLINEYKSGGYSSFFKTLNNTPFYDFKKINFKSEELELINYGIREELILKDGLCSVQSFKLFFEIQLIKDIDINIGIKFFDVSNNLLFILSSMIKNAEVIEQKGKYYLEFMLPKGILNNRIYFAKLFLLKNSNELIFREDSFLSVKMSVKNIKNKIEHSFGCNAMLAPPFELEIRKM